MGVFETSITSRISICSLVYDEYGPSSPCWKRSCKGFLSVFSVFRLKFEMSIKHIFWNICRHSFYSFLFRDLFDSLIFDLMINFLKVPALFYRLYGNRLGPLTAHNWQKWKRVFLTCPCHKIYRNEAVGLKSCKYTWKLTIFEKMWNLGQYRENLTFCQ